MRVIRQSKFQRHMVIPLMLTCFMTGCYKWSVQPASAISDEPPENARITLFDGKVVELQSPEIRGDSVVGFAKTESRGRTGQPVWGDTLQTYPLADVMVFEERKTDTVRIVVTSAVAVALVAGFVALYVSLKDFCIFCPPEE